ITNLRGQAAPVLDELARRHELSPALLPELRAIYSELKPITSWRLLGPFPISARPRVDGDRPPDAGATFDGAGGRRIAWQAAQVVDPKGQIDLAATYGSYDDRAAYGYAELSTLADRPAQMAVGSDDTLTVWLNGREVYEFSDRRGFEHEQ